MTKYNLCQFATVAVAFALIVPALGAPTQAGDNATLVASTLGSPGEPIARSILNKRGDHFTDFGANAYWKDAVGHKYANEADRYENQGRKSIGGTRFTVINNTPQSLSRRTWDRNFKIRPGESIQISNLPSHTGAIRAYAQCNEQGLDCAGHEGAATKWEWTTDPNGHVGALGINISLVDGYVIGGEITFGEGSHCWTMRCVIPQDELLKQCPRDNLDDRVNAWPSCKSDCAATNRDNFCCTGAFAGRGVCKPSSPHFSKLCPHAYAANPNGDVVLRLQN
ncbi:Osmotin, thaumatin-like protein [Stipitochalara longipes BDJ]|nr:Osmotin, thaumatin-like protein [Stipitochalara longipes BDJ]